MQMITLLYSSAWLFKNGPQSRGDAERLPPDSEDDLTSQASLADLDARIDKWVSSRDLKPPE